MNKIFTFTNLEKSKFKKFSKRVESDFPSSLHGKKWRKFKRRTWIIVFFFLYSLLVVVKLGIPSRVEKWISFFLVFELSKHGIEFINFCRGKDCIKWRKFVRSKDGRFVSVEITPHAWHMYFFCKKFFFSGSF